MTTDSPTPYPIEVETDEPCLCGNSKWNFITGGVNPISKCIECGRVYVERGTKRFLLIPWRGKFVQSTNPKTGDALCPVCGGVTIFDAPECRYTCVDNACGYSFVRRLAFTRTERRITESIDSLAREFFALDKGTEEKQSEILLKVQALKIELNASFEARWE